MSSFGGLIKELPGVSIDNFAESNVESVVFLLSHCHTDHMVGLNEGFFERLKSKQQHLYCSFISKQILLAKYPKISSPEVIKVLDIDVPTNLTYTIDGTNRINITVTCISSGHCPGSVMFILEKDSHTILFTGDFRYNVDDIKKYKFLKSFDNCMKKRFNTVYFDATFLSELFPKFPSRKQSVGEIIKISENWLNADPNNIVSLDTPANHGQEYIYKQLATYFQTKIHVRDEYYDLYSTIGISKYVTNDSSARIHDCNASHYSQKGVLTCKNMVESPNVLFIRPSAKIWENWNDSALSQRNGDKKSNFINVCYSSHSSLEELKAFIQHIECDNFVPFPSPIKSGMIGAYELIDSLKAQTSSEDGCLAQSNEHCFQFSVPRNIERLRSMEFKSKNISDDED